jgi:cell fate (sporulation/competence/biofilm development) regulator YmcA (YheA/YmcA/DUF963 family)
MKEKLRRKLYELLEAIDRLDVDAEEKKISELQSLIIQMDKTESLTFELKTRVKHLLHHYEKIAALQKMSSEIADLQEFIDKNG